MQRVLGIIGIMMILSGMGNGEEALFGEAQICQAGTGPLVYTSMVISSSESDLEAQTRARLDELEAVLGSVSSGQDRILRLHVYLRDSAAAPEVSGLLAARFDGRKTPAITYVQSALLVPGAYIALDAVALAGPSTAVQARVRTGEAFSFGPADVHAAVLPAGARAFISGRAALGDSLATAVHGTLEELKQDLATVEAGLGDAVSIKVFLNDMPRAAEVAQIISEYYGDTRLPVLQFAEWRHERPEQPVEIEMVAGVPAGEGRPEVEYFESSPNFSRIARVNAGDLLFVSGLYANGDAEAQVRGVFEGLATLLKPHGSGLGRLVKATYYLSEEEIGNQLRVQRPNIYPPGHSPAASLISVGAVGKPEHTLAMDMIAVGGDTP